MKITPEILEKFLFDAIDRLRNRVSASIAMKYLAGGFFLRFLSCLSEDEPFNDYSLNDTEVRWYVPANLRWEAIRASYHPEEMIVKAFEVIENENSTPIRGIVDSLSLTDLARDRNLCDEIIHIVSEIDLTGINKVEVATLTATLLSSLATASGVQGGEFYTSPSISNLLVKLLAPKPKQDIYDPACGTGSLLISAYHYVIAHNISSSKPYIYGQDVNPATVALALIHTVLGNIQQAVIKTGNSLLTPPENGVGERKKFDAILSNLPIGLTYDRERLTGLRQRHNDYAFGPPTRIQDFNFIQDALSNLKEDGRAVLLTGLRPLFIQGEEGIIRQRIVQADLIETVITLPDNLLPQTSAPCAILILNKNKPIKRRGKIQFISAEHEFKLEKKRQLISAENCEKIVSAALSMQDQPSFSVCADIEVIQANNFILLPAQYIGLNVNVILGNDVQWVELDKLASVLQGTKLGEYLEGEVPVIQGRDLSSPRLQIDDLEKKKIPQDLQKGIYAQSGDILVQRIGQKPRALLVEEELNGIIVSDTVYRMRFYSDDRPVARYLTEYLNSDTGRSQLAASGITGAIIPTLRVTALRKLKVPIPNNAVIELIKDLHEVETSLLDRVNKARQLRQQLFSIDTPEGFNEQLQNLSVEAGVLSKSLVSSDDFNFQIRNYYPYVLAYAYRSLDAYEPDSSLYKEQLRVAENLLAFLAAIGLCLAGWTASFDGSNNNITIESMRACWQRGVSPGDWRDFANKTATLLRGQEQFAAIAAFANVWFKGRGGKQSQFGATTQELVKLKNDFKHDRGPQTTYEYANAVQNIAEKLRQCLQEIAFLVQHPMRLVQGTDIEWRSKKAVVNTLVYAGDHPGLRQEQILLAEPLSKDKLYFELKDETLVPLYPLVSVHYCDSCKMRETYMIDRWEGPAGRTVLKSFERGHVHDNNQIAKQVSNDFEYWLNTTFNKRA